MLLLTHNMLTSNCIKGVSNGYPLIIKANSIKKLESDFNPEFLIRMIPKLDWNAFYKATQMLEDVEVSVPEKLIESYDKDTEFLKKVHHALLEVEIVEGDLECPESGRKFPISSGIPNMLLKEDEV
uniref:Multifunctional methyltransferase subunit TRM112-like protein n=1 Tax=Cacopsylla melanoneura TaxID=428564 RepID=A0A8D8TC91_9HEMI